MNILTNHTETLEEDIESLISKLEKFRNADSNIVEKLGYLRESLKDRHLKQLIYFDLKSIIDPNYIEEWAVDSYQKFPAWLSILEWIRNIFILVPIALTWYGLSEASSTYNELLQRDKALYNVPFLLLWEQGFPGIGRAYPLTFSRIALLDVIIMGSLVLINIIVHYWRDIRESSARKQASDLRAHVERVIWKISQVMAMEAYSSNRINTEALINMFTRDLKDNIQQLSGVLESERGFMKDLKIQLGQTSNSIQSFNGSVISGISELSLQLKNISAIYGQMNHVQQQYNDSIKQITVQQRDFLELLKLMDNNTTSLTGGIADIKKALVDELNNIKQADVETVQQLTDVLNRSSNMSERIIDVEKSLAKELNNIKQADIEIAQSISGILNKSAEWSSILEMSQASLRDMSKDNGNPIEHFKETSNPIDKMALESNHAIVQRFDDTSNRIIASLDVLIDEFRQSNRTIKQNLGSVYNFRLGAILLVATIAGGIIVSIVQYMVFR